VAAHTGRQLDYTSQEAGEDPATRALFRTGRTMGVFYTESPASRALCIKSRAESFELLVLNTSIIRPASNKWIKVYLERLHGGDYQPIDPCLRDVLGETFGVMVYQEDVVNVAAVFAGMPLATGDGLRKALSKKRPTKALASYTEEFLAGALALGRDPAVIAQVWHQVLSFAGYSFCKGHSCSYIQVAQQSAFLKAHYPAEFFAAVLANGGGFYHPFAYVAEARRAGLVVLPPDVNASEFRTTGRGGELRIGFQFVKGLSQAGVEAVLGGERPYPSLTALRDRSGVGHDDLRLLIKVGALDSIAQGMTRPEMLWCVDAGEARREKGEARSLPAHALGHGPGALLPSPFSLLAPPPQLPEYDATRRREDAYARLGFTTDAHPMDLYRDRLRRWRLTPSTELHRHVGQTVLCAGMLTTAKPVHTAKDEPMQFATFDDGHGLLETVMFPDIHRKRSHVLFDQGPFLFRGVVEQEFGAISVTMTGLERVERAGAVSSER
jgi:DNA polymerase III alpha subunit